MSWPSGCLLTLAALTLGQALQVNNGMMHPVGMGWLLASSLLALAGLATARRSDLSSISWNRALTALLLGGVLVQLFQLLVAPPVMYADIERGADDPLVLAAVTASAVLVVVIAITSRRVRCLAFAAFLACQAALGVWTIHRVPDPVIDVVTVQRQAIATLAEARTPYTLTFKNIYGHTGFYGEGMATGDRVLFGLPYPPLTLAFTAPAQLIFGDFRIGHVAALIAAALLIASLGWTAHAMLAAALLLTTPRVLFVLEQGWTEPSAVMLLALTVAMLWRRSPGVPISLGLLFAAKQYLVIAMLLTPLLRLPGGTTKSRTLVLALATAAAVTLPFLLWDPRGFINSVLLLQLREPFRLDSLSALAWMAGRGFEVPAIALTVAAALAGVGLALWRLPRSSGGFAAGLAVVTLLLFLFGKKAFGNYYFFVLGAMAAAIAAAGEEEAPSDKASSIAAP